MEPIRHPPVTKLPVTVQTPVNPIVSLARSRLPDLLRPNGPITRNVQPVEKPGFLDAELMRHGFKKIPATGPVPFDIFRQMGPEEMLSHKETLECITIEEFEQLTLEHMRLLAPHLNLLQFAKLFNKLERNLPLEFVLQLPLISQLFCLKKTNNNEIRSLISDHFVSYMRTYKQDVYTAEDKYMIHLVQYLNVFNEMTLEDGFALPREVWEIAVHSSDNKPDLQLLGPVLGAVPLDLLNTLIVTFKLDKAENMLPTLRVIEQSLSEDPEAKIKFKNIINFLHDASQKYAQGKSFISDQAPIESKIQIDIPKLSPETEKLIDSFLNQSATSLNKVDAELDQQTRVFFETLNEKIFFSYIFEDDALFEKYKAYPLTLFTILFDKLKGRLKSENLPMQIPHSRQLYWACKHLDTIIQTLEPIAADRRKAFEFLINYLNGLHPEMVTSLFGSSHREYWIAFKKEGLHLRMKNLDLKMTGLKFIPPEVWEMSNLQKLNLSYNKITTLPAEIQDLKNLEVLNLSSNDLTVLPQELYELKKLQALGINYNRKLQVPSKVFNITSLLELDCSGCRLIEMPVSVDLPNLRVFHANNCGLVRVSSSLFRSKYLLEIKLNDNFLSEIPIPDEISNNTRLLTLNLHRNQLKDFPPGLLKIPSLKELDLSFNLITSIPSDLAKMTSLKHLDLKNNRLSALPNLSTSEITWLNLSRNSFTDLKEPLPPKLEIFQVSSNQLKNIPESVLKLTYLKTLVMGSNQLIEVDARIIYLSRLQELLLDDNELTTLPLMPPLLKYLNISNNHFKAIPESLLQHPTDLQVEVSGNSIPPFQSPNPLLRINGLSEQQFPEKQL